MPTAQHIAKIIQMIANKTIHTKVAIDHLTICGGYSDQTILAALNPFENSSAYNSAAFSVEFTAQPVSVIIRIIVFNILSNIYNPAKLF